MFLGLKNGRRVKQTISSPTVSRLATKRAVCYMDGSTGFFLLLPVSVYLCICLDECCIYIMTLFGVLATRHHDTLAPVHFSVGHTPGGEPCERCS
jgi:hypothetical protein